MKKILTILASLTIMGSTVATVVACGTNTETENDHLHDSVNLTKDVRNRLVLKLKNDPNLGFNLEDFWNEETINKIIDNFIDDQVSKHFTKDLENDFNHRLHLEDKNLSSQIQYGLVDGNKSMLDPNNAIAQEVNNLNYSNVLMRFFTEYTASIAINRFNALDTKLEYLSLNPTKIVGKNNGEEITNLSLYYQIGDGSWNRWTSINDWNPVDGEDTPLNNFNVALGEYIPEQALLSTKSEDNKFVLVQNSNALNLATLPTAGEVNNDGDQAILIQDHISGYDALGYRFQKYLRTKQAENYKNLLPIQFMRNQMFRFASAPAGTNSNNQPSVAETAAQQAIYYNTDSHFIRNVQTWENGSGRNFDTDLKMVWTISLKDKDVAGKANKLLQDANQDEANKLNDYATFADSSESLYKDDVNQNTKGNSILQILSILTGLDGKAAATTPTDIIKRINEINLSENGSDPVFGIKGFQGFVRNNGSDSIEAVLGGNLNVAEAAKTKIAKTNVSSVIKSSSNATIGQQDFVFDNKTENKNTKDIVVVLPLYLLDLWKSVKETTDANAPVAEQNKVVDYATNQWVHLLPQVTGATWTTAKPTASAGWTEVSETSKELPTTNSFKRVDTAGNGLEVGTYVYIVQNDPTQKPSANPLTLGSTAVEFAWSDNSTTVSRNYGYTGVSEISDRAAITNGQKVKFKVHLGQDNGLANTMEQSWNQRENRFKRNDDIAYYLNGEEKENLTNILMAIVESTHSEISEEAKGQVYRRYIDPNDIYYRRLYDSLIDYIKHNDDDVEDSD